jgi:hypothetical protein
MEKKNITFLSLSLSSDSHIRATIIWEAEVVEAEVASTVEVVVVVEEAASCVASYLNFLPVVVEAVVEGVGEVVASEVRCYSSSS